MSAHVIANPSVRCCCCILLSLCLLVHEYFGWIVAERINRVVDAVLDDTGDTHGDCRVGTVEISLAGFRPGLLSRCRLVCVGTTFPSSSSDDIDLHIVVALFRNLRNRVLFLQRLD
jgi:hypothetical protein